MLVGFEHSASCTCTSERAGPASPAHPADKVEFPRLLKDRGRSLDEIAAKTGIPNTSVHRYLAVVSEPRETEMGLTRSVPYARST